MENNERRDDVRILINGDLAELVAAVVRYEVDPCWFSENDVSKLRARARGALAALERHRDVDGMDVDSVVEVLQRWSLCLGAEDVAVLRLAAVVDNPLTNVDATIQPPEICMGWEFYAPRPKTTDGPTEGHCVPTTIVPAPGTPTERHAPEYVPWPKQANGVGDDLHQEFCRAAEKLTKPFNAADIDKQLPRDLNVDDRTLRRWLETMETQGILEHNGKKTKAKRFTRRRMNSSESFRINV